MLTIARDDDEGHMLQRQHPWLKELTESGKNHPSLPELVKSQKAFFENGNHFMLTLRRFVQAETRREFYCWFVDDRNHGAWAQHLLYLLDLKEKEMSASPPPDDWSRNRVQPEDTHIPDSEGVFRDRIFKMVQCRREKSQNTSGILRQVRL